MVVVVVVVVAVAVTEVVIMVVVVVAVVVVVCSGDAVTVVVLVLVVAVCRDRNVPDVCVALPFGVSCVVCSLPPQVFAVSCGRSFTTCVTMDGELFAWGINVHGECGIGAGAAKGAVAMAA